MLVVTVVTRLDHLHDDPHCLLGVQERLAPVRAALAVADDSVAERLGSFTGGAERRHVEGHVVDAGTVPVKEAVHEAARRTVGLDDLEPTTARVVPVPPAILSHRAPVAAPPSQLPDKEGERVRDPVRGNGDVIEGDGHGPGLL